MLGKTAKRIRGTIALVIAIAGIGGIYYIYTMKNPSVPVTEPSKIKVACIGDSITYGAGVLKTREEDSYPALLGKLLGEGYQVLNYGLSGRTLLNEGDQPYSKEILFEESKEAEPDIVLIMLGTNDSKPYNWNAEDYETELQEFVNLYQELPCDPEVYLMTCCAAFVMEGQDEVAYHIDAAVIEDELAGIIRQAGENCNVPVIDIYQVTEGHPEYFSDGVHPNAKGNQAIAQAVYECLQQ